MMKKSKIKILAGMSLLLFLVNMGCFGEDADEDLLSLAVSQNKIEDVRSLLANGAAVDGTGVIPQTPLMIAAVQGNTAIVRILLASGADPNKITPHDESALYYAAFGGHEDTVRELLNQSGSHDLVNRKHTIFLTTPLSVAVPTGHPMLVRMLLEVGADPNIPDLIGETVFDHCRQNKDNPACSVIDAIK
uniref:Ankyrin repeat-containing protein n=1 Tax=Candidatus Kentrum sp. UNK TaxID=2126344 RepID=A0A451A9X9_9GAMM|nr:MAG: Ankyrin repeat-containing protein [Candidatus Kentron sp. UNK]VFK70618.1 MAG: Ankyrin repeat-containing protein [Candidatus Kentron sp. UNK]